MFGSDKNECALNTNPCIYKKTCKNVPGGGSKCSCPKNLEGDGLRKGQGCRPRKDKNTGNLILIIGLSKYKHAFKHNVSYSLVYILGSQVKSLKTKHVTFVYRFELKSIGIGCGMLKHIPPIP